MFLRCPSGEQFVITKLTNAFHNLMTLKRVSRNAGRSEGFVMCVFLDEGRSSFGLEGDILFEFVFL